MKAYSADNVLAMASPVAGCPTPRDTEIAWRRVRRVPLLAGPIAPGQSLGQSDESTWHAQHTPHLRAGRLNNIVKLETFTYNPQHG